MEPPSTLPQHRSNFYRTLYLRIAEWRLPHNKPDSGGSGGASGGTSSPSAAACYNPSDPIDAYVQVSVGDTLVRTRTIWKQKEPFWGEDHTIILDSSPKLLSLQDPLVHVYTPQDRPLAAGSINLAALQQSAVAQEPWIFLRRCLAVPFRPPPANMPAKLTFQALLKQSSQDLLDQVLCVRVESCSGLYRGELPTTHRKTYVRLLLDPQPALKSATVIPCLSNKLNFNQEFLWFIPNETIITSTSSSSSSSSIASSLSSSPSLIIQVYNSRTAKGGSDTLLAHLQLPLSAFGSKITRHSVDLIWDCNDHADASTVGGGGGDTLVANTDSSAKSSSEVVPFGDIRIKMQYQEQIVLPKECYSELMLLLLDPQLELVSALEEHTKGAGKLEMVALTLARIFHSKGMILHLIKGLTSKEINQTPSPEVLFRGNSLSTKLLDAYMKLIGLGYLKETLDPVLQIVFNLKRSVELDVTKLDKGADKLEKQVHFLFDLTTQFLTAIFGSIRRCPDVLKAIFHHMKREVARRFSTHPEVDVIQFTVVSSMLFLRFFVPAILNPILFGLHDQFADEATARTLTLIAKAIQTLANLVEFSEKEAYMLPLNPMIMECTPLMIQFLNSVSTHDDTVVMSDMETDDIWSEKELATIATTVKNILPAIETSADPQFAERIATMMNDLQRAENSLLESHQSKI